MAKGTGSRVVESGIHVEGGETDEWATPRDFLRPISEAVGGFDLDPASGAESSPIAEETFALERGEDGLSEPWHGRVWCNPPYSEKDDWTEKAWKESTREEVEFVALLLSVDTSSDRFHTFVPRASYVYLHDSRLKFGDADDSAPGFPLTVRVGDEGPLLAVGGEHKVARPLREGLNSVPGHGSVVPLDDDGPVPVGVVTVGGRGHVVLS